MGEKQGHRWEISEAKTADGEFMVTGGEGQAWGLVASVGAEDEARLIAAAPDLLEALDPDLLDVAATLFEQNKQHQVAKVMRNAAKDQRAAMVKATGALDAQ